MSCERSVPTSWRLEPKSVTLFSQKLSHSELCFSDLTFSWLLTLGLIKLLSMGHGSPLSFPCWHNVISQTLALLSFKEAEERWGWAWRGDPSKLSYGGMQASVPFGYRTLPRPDWGASSALLPCCSITVSLLSLAWSISMLHLPWTHTKKQILDSKLPTSKNWRGTSGD